MHSGEYHIGIRKLGETGSLTPYPIANILVVQSFTDIVDFLATWYESHHFCLFFLEGIRCQAVKFYPYLDIVLTWLISKL